MVFAARIKGLQALLHTHEVDFFVIDSPVDLLYLTGLSVSLGRMLISQDKELLFVDGRYIDFAKKRASCEVHLLSTISSFLKTGIKVGFDSAFTTCEEFDHLQKMFPGRHFKPIAQILNPLRMIKSAPEIVALRKAAKLTMGGYHHIVKMLKEGVSEKELAWEFESFCRTRGASGMSFPPIIAFGENSAYPHHRAGDTRLQKNTTVLLDLGAVVDHYAGDMTRVTFFGKGDPQILRDLDVIQKAQKKAIALVKPGVRFGDLMDVVMQELTLAGCAELFTHGLSHGIGLDVHESPRLKLQGGDSSLILQEGMAFTVEPGVYRVGLGGVRYEDVVVVTKDGHEIL